MTSQLVLNVQGRLPIGGEFQGKNGDCTEYAFMVARTSETPSQPCDAAELNRLTNKSISAGEAGPSGSMTTANIAWLCASEGVPYQQDASGIWASVIAQEGGKHAIVLQVSNGSQLPGNEGGVNGHAVAVLDYDSLTQRVTIANGDSVNGRAGQLDVIHMADIANSQPFGITLLLITPTGGGTPGVSIIIVRDPSGAITGAHDAVDASLTIGRGFAEQVAANHWEQGSIRVPEVYLQEGESICVIRGGVRVAMTYSTGAGVIVYGQADVVKALNNLYDNWQAAKHQASS